MSRSQTTRSNEPTQADIDYLNSIEGVIGLDKPNVDHHIEPEYLPAYQLEIEDGDHLRIDEQGLE
jgi:hypothetical protein